MGLFQFKVGWFKIKAQTNLGPQNYMYLSAPGIYKEFVRQKFKGPDICTILRMRQCGVRPLPIIFERLKLPQQIIYRRKGNLSESPNQ